MSAEHRRLAAGFSDLAAAIASAQAADAPTPHVRIIVVICAPTERGHIALGCAGATSRGELDPEQIVEVLAMAVQGYDVADRERRTVS